MRLRQKRAVLRHLAAKGVKKPAGGKGGKPDKKDKKEKKEKKEKKK